jgi:RimJ/RimL family protein N-acetyltransferase
MHLHNWNHENRGKGLGMKFVQKCIPIFFEKLQLKTLFCQPYALNPGPNKTLKKLGFTLVETSIMKPNPKAFTQEVNTWSLRKENL